MPKNNQEMGRIFQSPLRAQKYTKGAGRYQHLSDNSHPFIIVPYTEMASNESQICCFTGFFHEGTPKGEFKQVCGLETYVTGKTDSERFIVILTDIYGHKYNNVRLIADKLGDAGYHVFIPDILFNDAVLNLDTIDFKEWLAKHHTEKTVNLVSGFFKELRDTYSPKFVGTIGYCFGAKYAVQQLHWETGQADAGAIAHPSFVSVEEVESIGKPILISAAEADDIFSAELRHKTEKILKEKGAMYQMNLFSGVNHGFSVRGDLSDANVIYAMGRTLLDQIYWFDHFPGKTGSDGK